MNKSFYLKKNEERVKIYQIFSLIKSMRQYHLMTLDLFRNCKGTGLQFRKRSIEDESLSKAKDQKQLDLTIKYIRFIKIHGKTLNKTQRIYEKIHYFFHGLFSVRTIASYYF